MKKLSIALLTILTLAAPVATASAQSIWQRTWNETVAGIGGFSEAETLQIHPQLGNGLQLELLGTYREGRAFSTDVRFENLSDLEIEIVSQSLEFYASGVWRTIQTLEESFVVLGLDEVELHQAVSLRLPRVTGIGATLRGRFARPRIDDVFRVRVTAETADGIHEEAVEFTLGGN